MKCWSLLNFALFVSAFWVLQNQPLIAQEATEFETPFNGRCKRGIDCQLVGLSTHKSAAEAQTHFQTDTLGPFLRLRGCGINYVVASTKLSNRTAPYTVINPRMFISGVGSPNGVEILEAYLYWIVEGNRRTSSVRLSGPAGSRLVTGQLIGLGRGGKCWPCANTHHFRADVKDLICRYDPNGEYVISDYPQGHRECRNPPDCRGGFALPGGCDQGDTDGAMLLIIYRDYSANYEGNLAIDDGCIIRLGGDRVRYTLNAGSACGVPNEGRGFIALGDLQAGSAPPHNLTIGPVTFPIQPRFFNFETAPLGFTTSNLNTNFAFENLAGGDCYSIVLVGVYAQATSCQPGCAPTIQQTAEVNGRIDTVRTCQLNAPVTLTLSGYEGTIVRWERADQCSTGNWVTLSQTQPRLAVANPSASACWRVVLNRNGCLTYSALGRIQINGRSNGGQVEPNQRVCPGQQPGILQLTGTTGRVLRWERAQGDDCRSTNLRWETVSGTQNGILPPPATTSSCWRAIVAEGDCDPSPSEPASIQVLSAIQPGYLSLEGGDCTTGQASFLTLNGHTGNQLTWQFAPTCNGTWQSTRLNGTRHPVSALTVPGCYRVLVGSPDCEPIPTEPLEIRESTGSVPGTLVAPAEHCPEAGPLELRLVGSPANIVRWEWSDDGFRRITTLSQTANPLRLDWPSSASNTLEFRVWVQLGNCAPQVIGPVPVRRLTSPPRPNIQGPSVVCPGTTSLTLTALPATIQVLYWESQADNATNWTRIEHTQRTLLATAPTVTTRYRVVSSGGACPPLVSEPHRVEVSSLTQPGRVIGGGQFCSLGQPVELRLIDQEGQVLDWERSTNGQSGWTSLGANGTVLRVQVEAAPVWYRARIQNNGCPPAYSRSDSVFWTTPPNAGQVIGPSQVCSGSESFRLNLVGVAAPILRWEQALENSSTWTTLSTANSTSIDVPGIDRPTRYRAVIQAGDCPPVYSTSWSVGLVEPAQAGQLIGATTGCGTALNARLELSRFNGSILRWESQPEGATTWSTINHTAPVLVITTLPTTTRFRVVVGRGNCTPAISSAVELTVIPPSLGGQVNSNATVCRGQPAPILRLTGHTGRVLDWYFSKDRGSTWVAMKKPNQTSLQTGRLTVETWFRAEVQAGNCPSAFSEAARIQVYEAPRAGWVEGDTLICHQNTGSTLNLQAYSGAIRSWQLSYDGTTWFDLNHSNPRLQTGTIKQTTWYRVVMAANGCVADTSPPHRISLLPVSLGGVLHEDRSICSGGTSGPLQLQGHRGSIRFWEVSEDQGRSWSQLAYTGQIFESDPLYRSTWYRAVIQNGSCPPAYSTTAKVTLVNELAGGRLLGGPAFCSNAASLTLRLASSSGSVRQWEFSTDDGRTWAQLSHQFTSYEVRNLTQPTRFRVLVQSGSCAGVYSSSVSLEPRPAPTLQAQGAVSCEGWGAIEAKATGGNGGYLYTLSESTQPANSHGRFAPLATQPWLVIVRDAAGCSDTQSVDLTLLHPRPDIEHVIHVSATSATVVWRAIPGNTVRYRVSYRIVGQPTASRQVIDGLRSNAVTLNGLQHDTPYEVRVEADCGGRVVESVAPAFFYTLPSGDCSTQPPPAPGGLVVDRITPTTAVFRWRPIHNLAPHQGYIISFGREPINPQNWPQFVVCAPDSQFLIANLTPSTAYAVRIRTNCTNCTTALQSTDRRSAWSAAVAFHTLSIRESSPVTIERDTTLTIYPNPCRGEIQLNVTEGGQVVLFDPLGQKLTSHVLEAEGTFRIELPAHYASGIYLVRWIGNSGRIRQGRLVVVRD